MHSYNTEAHKESIYNHTTHRDCYPYMLASLWPKQKVFPQRTVAEGNSKGYWCVLSFPGYDGDNWSTCRPFTALIKFDVAPVTCTRNLCEDHQSGKPSSNHSIQNSQRSSNMAKLLPLPLREPFKMADTINTRGDVTWRFIIIIVMVCSRNFEQKTGTSGALSWWASSVSSC